MTVDKSPDLLPVLMKLDTSRITSLMLPIKGFGMINGASVNLVNETRLEALRAGLRKGDVGEYLKRYGTDYTPR